MLAAAVVVVLAVLARWRYGHDGWLAARRPRGLALVLLIAAAVIGMRSARHRRAAAGDSRPDRAQRRRPGRRIVLGRRVAADRGRGGGGRGRGAGGARAAGRPARGVGRGRGAGRRRR